MAESKEKKATRLFGGNESEKLSELNTQGGRRKNPAQRLRRKMEASIEAKARKRRAREAPASAAWKP
jgi:hypothetical protein